MPAGRTVDGRVSCGNDMHANQLGPSSRLSWLRAVDVVSQSCPPQTGVLCAHEACTSDTLPPGERGSRCRAAREDGKASPSCQAVGCRLKPGGLSSSAGLGATYLPPRRKVRIIHSTPTCMQPTLLTHKCVSPPSGPGGYRRVVGESS